MLATVMGWLEDVDAGGGTAFTHWDVEKVDPFELEVLTLQTNNINYLLELLLQNCRRAKCSYAECPYAQYDDHLTSS
jgi:hypothetical protein